MNIETNLRALNSGAREPAQRLLYLAREKGWHVEEIEAALGALADEAHRWKDNWAHSQVDKDRKVREASDRALDCTEHGKVIADLEKSVHQISQSATAHDKARGALAVGLLEIGEHLKALQAKAGRGEQVPTAKQLIDTLAKAVAKVHERGRLK